MSTSVVFAGAAFSAEIRGKSATEVGFFSPLFFPLSDDKCYRIRLNVTCSPSPFSLLQWTVTVQNQLYVPPPPPPPNVHAHVNHTLHRNMKHGSADAHTLPAAAQSQGSTAVSRLATHAGAVCLNNSHPATTQTHSCFVPWSPQAMRDAHAHAMHFDSYAASHSTTKIIHAAPTTLSRDNFPLKAFAVSQTGSHSTDIPPHHAHVYFSRVTLRCSCNLCVYTLFAQHAHVSTPYTSLAYLFL